MVNVWESRRPVLGAIDNSRDNRSLCGLSNIIPELDAALAMFVIDSLFSCHFVIDT